MKLPVLFSLILFLLFSCSTERGTVEIESLSKKVFDAMKANDFGGIKEIIPSKHNFEKIYAMQGKANNVDIDSVYEKFLAESEMDFKKVRAGLQNWEEAVYANTNESIGKEENVSFTTIMAKFKVGDSPKKISFTGAKINGRWYYYAGLQWMVQDSLELNRDGV